MRALVRITNIMENRTVKGRCGGSEFKVENIDRNAFIHFARMFYNGAKVVSVVAEVDQRPDGTVFPVDSWEIHAAVPYDSLGEM